MSDLTLASSSGKCAIDLPFAIMVPYFRYVQRHLLSMRALSNQYDLPIFEFHGFPYIDMARAKLVEDTLARSDAKVLMFIDDDIIFNARDVIGVCKNCLQSKYDILAGAYAVKRFDSNQVVVSPKEDSVIRFFEDGLYDATRVALGFTAIKREVFEALKTKLPFLMSATGTKLTPYFHHMITETNYFGEDYSFCERAKEAGFKIGIDAKPRLMHSGNYEYGLEDIKQSPARYSVLNISFSDPPTEANHND